MDRLSKYPLDFAALKKDSWIEPQELMTILGCQPGSQKWDLGVLKLRGLIEDNSGILVRMSGFRMRLMTDHEADEWTHRGMYRHIHGLVRSAKRRTLIDRSDFSLEEKREAESRDRISASVARSAVSEVRKMRQLEKLKNLEISSG